MKTWTAPSIKEFKVEDVTKNGGDGPADGVLPKDEGAMGS